MFKGNGSFVIFALLFLFFCDRTSSECTQLTPCLCVFANGEGYDLTNLTNSGTLKATASNRTFIFQPCKNAALTSNRTDECSTGNGVSLCVQQGNQNRSLGTIEETKLVFQPGVAKQPNWMLRHANSTTIVSLSCCETCQTQLSVDSIPNDLQYHLLLVSPYACKALLHAKGLSTGSILVILLFVFSGIYFIGGAVALKLLRGATGWEMLPNHEFWCELPSLVRDGIIFTFNCFRADSYERI